MQDAGSGRESPPQPILVAQDLHRMYGPRRALRSLSFSQQAGRVLGFLGPNGAGKTTTIRVLTTILKPTSGRFVVDGIGSEHPDQIRRVIGVLPEGLGFPRHGTGLEYLTYFGRLYGRPNVEARRVALGLLEDVGLSARGNTQMTTYSHGMRQRLGIARALVNDPRVVFLDEPTLGLDPRGQQELLSLIQRIATERGAAVVLSSHLLSEIEGICDDVVIMNAGQVVAKGTVAEVLTQAGADGSQQDVVRVRVPVASTPTALAALGTVEGIASVEPDATGWLSVTFDHGDESIVDREHNRVLDALIRADVPVHGFELGGMRLQDVFLQLTAEAIE